ncbi:MAG: RNA-binding protein [Clostridia bacterium]|jgi:large subunit ribosomal protein L14e|nr:RNA-binding protein [Clostridia bacterium]
MVELEPGQLVLSTAGRDQGRAFLVLGFEETHHGTFVYVADGKYRKVHRPKRKNIKHLKATKLKEQEISNRLKTGSAVSNAELKKAVAGLLAIYQENSEAGEGGR